MSTSTEQMELAERLQMKLLNRFDTLLDEGTITSTDVATLVRLLSMNGWVLDATRVPSGLRSKLTLGLSVNDFTNDGKVVPIRNAGQG